MKLLTPVSYYTLPPYYSFKEKQKGGKRKELKTEKRSFCSIGALTHKDDFRAKIGLLYFRRQLVTLQKKLVTF